MLLAHFACESPNVVGSPRQASGHKTAQIAAATLEPASETSTWASFATGGAEPLRYTPAMDLLRRITRDPAVMGGRPCIRGMRVTVGTVVGLLAAGRTEAEILEAYPYLEPDDIRAALSYAAWRTEEIERPLA